MQRTEANLEDHGRSKEQIDRLQAKAGEINGNSPCALGNGGGATPPAGLLITRKSSVRFGRDYGITPLVPPFVLILPQQLDEC